MKPAVPLASVVREDVRRRGLRAFIEWFWPIIDAAPYCHNWHIDAICEHLEAVTRRDIKRLVINVPPGFSKSSILSVLWPAWQWATNPKHRWMFASFDQTLVNRDSKRMIAVVQSPLYRKAFPSGATFAREPQVGEVWNDQKGYRFNTSVRGKATGKHCNTQAVDDPIKPRDAEASSELSLKDCEHWWDKTMSTRRAHPVADFARVIQMQAICVGALDQLSLERGYEHLCIPMRFEPAIHWDRGSSIGGCRDPRQNAGEVLDPRRVPPETVAEQEEELGPDGAEAQLQQNPQPKGSEHVKAEWLEHTYTELPVKDQFLRYVQVWDFNVKGGEGNSRVSGLLAAIFRNDAYLIDERCDYWNWVAGKREFTRCQQDPIWRKAGRIYIEDKANGSPLLQELEGTDVGRKCEAVQPTAGFSKTERFDLQTDKLAQGRIRLPDKPWVAKWRQEIKRFPVKPNDRADTLEMLLRKCIQDKASGASVFQEAAKTVQSWG